jgi:hypothetical protein
MDEDNNNNTQVNSHSLALRVQKNIASKMASKNMAKVFIDETTGRILDNLYKLAKEYTSSKKEAEKLLKDTIKIIIKIGILHKNNEFSSDELRLCDEFRHKFHFLTKSALSFYEIDYTFDRQHLCDSLKQCKDMTHQIIRRHLTDKSKHRVDHVYDFFSDPKFLEEVYKPQGKHRAIFGLIVDDARKLLDDGYL